MLYAARYASGVSKSHNWRTDFLPKMRRNNDLATEIGRLRPGAQVYVSGPMGLLTLCVTFSRNRPPTLDLRYETFAKPDAMRESFWVRIAGRKLSDHSENKSILNSPTEAGIEVMFDCRRGECGCSVTCRDHD
jgi:vanillate O-demethylase ferredoxin subunit